MRGPDYSSQRAPRAVTSGRGGAEAGFPGCAAGPDSGCPCRGGGAGGRKMAADLEAEVQAIDKSLLECSAEEIAVVSRGPARGEKRLERREKGAGGRGAGTVLPGRRWGPEGRGLFVWPGLGRGEAEQGSGVLLAGQGASAALAPLVALGPLLSPASLLQQRGPSERTAGFSCCCGSFQRTAQARVALPRLGE